MAGRLLLDTNVLLTATDPSRLLHGKAQAVFTLLPGRGDQLFLCGQVVREYLVVATRDLTKNGLGMSVQDALANVQMFRNRCGFLDETAAVVNTLQRLLLTIYCSGKQIHDANIAAVAITHGVKEIVTENWTDFARFHPQLSVFKLADV